METAINQEITKSQIPHSLSFFLKENENEILKIAQDKTFQLVGDAPTSEKLKIGIPLFYKQLLEIFEREGEILSVHDSAARYSFLKKEMEKTAGEHGNELLKLGYALSQVVHAYGSVCQAITELAAIRGNLITAPEFSVLNLCLDIAIAGAVTEYGEMWSKDKNKKEIEHLGVLAHELRNALTSVMIAVQLIKKGTVGISGKTSEVLDSGLKRIQELIDQSLTDFRLRSEKKVNFETYVLLQLIDQITLTLQIEAQSKNLELKMLIDPEIVIVVDTQLFSSALSNIIQNAIKFTPSGRRILVRGMVIGEKIVIEVEDECGGLPDNALLLFKPYEQYDVNKKGLGLGLTIAKKAIEACRGTIEVRNLKGKGCIFSVILPKP